MFKLAALVSLLPFLATVNAHGQLFNAYADGKLMLAPNVRLATLLPHHPSLNRYLDLLRW